MEEVRVIAIVRRSLLRHLNGHPDRQFYANLIGVKVALVSGTERGEDKMASVEVRPLASPSSCPVRLRTIFLEVLKQPVQPAAVKTLGKPALVVSGRPAPTPNGNGQALKREVHKPKPHVVFKAVRRSGLSRGLR